jgi:hypothetical protein
MRWLASLTRDSLYRLLHPMHIYFRLLVFEMSETVDGGWSLIKPLQNAEDERGGPTYESS